MPSPACFGANTFFLCAIFLLSFVTRLKRESNLSKAHKGFRFHIAVLAKTEKREWTTRHEICPHEALVALSDSNVAIMSYKIFPYRVLFTTFSVSPSTSSDWTSCRRSDRAKVDLRARVGGRSVPIKCLINQHQRFRNWIYVRNAWVFGKILL